jgi:hypothetical protein
MTTETEFVFVGCDPGVKGAVAAIGCDRSVFLAEQFPTIKTPKAPRRMKRKDKDTGEMVMRTVHGTKTEFDHVATASLFDRVALLPGRKIAVVEDVTSGPHDSVTASFTFGGSLWAIRQALADRGIPYENIKPKVWQGVMLTGQFHDSDARKAAYLARARTMFPDVDLRLKKHAEEAAALLLAEYARRQFIHLGGIHQCPTSISPSTT